MNLADADRAVARSLKLALAGGEGSAFLAAQIEKRLRAIAHARAFLDWDKVHRLADEIDDLRRTIATTLAEADIHAAVAQMRALIASALPDDLESHQAFTDRLRQKHGKKVAFSTLLPK